MEQQPPQLSKNCHLLTLAKNISVNKLMDRVSLKNSVNKNDNKQSLGKDGKNCSPVSSLLHGNFAPSKERSRSLNAMMSSLIKQSYIVKENKAENKADTKTDTNTMNTTNNTNNTNNLHQININSPEMSSSFCSNDDPDNLSTVNLNTSFISQALPQSSNAYYSDQSVCGNMNSNRSICGDQYSNKTNNGKYRALNILSTVLDKKTVSSQYRQGYRNYPYQDSSQKTFIYSSSSTANGPTKIINNSNTNYAQYLKENCSNSPMSMSNMCSPSSPSYNRPTEIIQSECNNTQQQRIVYTYIQIEDWIVLEEKWSNIIDSFKMGNQMKKLCIEWWNFYNYSSWNGQFENWFTDNSAYRQIAHDSSALEVLAIILIYEILKDPKVTQSTVNTLKNLITEIHQNYLVMCDYILYRISTQSMTNIWVNKIQNIILSKRTRRIYRNEYITVLKKNNEYIASIFKNILRVYVSISYSNQKIDISALNYYLKNISKTTIKSLNDYFRKKVNIDCCKTGDIFTFVIQEAISMPSIPIPYWDKKRGSKIFTLILDLDETLISFRIDEKRRGIWKVRPGLEEFLSKWIDIYEWVIFTAGTQEYADPIWDAIENGRKLFEKRLYRQHAVIIENDFVKDLSKLGRDISKVIIIDNTPQNFRLQKENGIFIKNYYGEDNNDRALLDLIPILLDIAGDNSNDVRKEIKRLKNEIFTKITSNLNE